MRIWLISGAGRGIGYLLVTHLLAAGECVYATSRNIAPLEALRNAYPDHLRVRVMDVAIPEQIQAAVDDCVQHWGRVDVLFCNAGYAVFGTVEEATDAQMTAILETNVYGSVRLIKACLPTMRAAGCGHVIQMSSVGGQATWAAVSLYHMTKWAIEGLCEGLAQEVAPFGVRVTIIEPASVATDFTANGVITAPIEDYRAVPEIGGFIAHLETGRARSFPVSDPEKIVREIMAIAGEAHPPLRLALGSNAYRDAHRCITERLQVLEENRAITQSTDLTEWPAR